MAPVSVLDEPRISRPQFYDGESYTPRIEWLRPWEGFFVFNEIPGASLHIPVLEDSSSQIYKAAAITQGIHGLTISITDAAAGLRDNVTVHFDTELPKLYRPLNYLKPPPIKDFVQVGVVQGKYIVSEGHTITGEEGSTFELELRSNLHISAADVSLTEFGTIPADLNIYIVDAGSRSLIAKNLDRFTLGLQADIPRRIQVIIGDEQYARSLNGGREFIPSGVLLEDVHPNPVHTAAAFRYRVGELSNVRFTIHDLFGRTIRSWNFRDQQPGYHFVPWDGYDSNGQSPPPGVYIYTLSTDASQQSKTLIHLP
jgi:hypothetical protein